VDIEEYLSNLGTLGRIYREIFGMHYPAMALVRVVRLVERARALRLRRQRLPTAGRRRFEPPESDIVVCPQLW